MIVVRRIAAVMIIRIVIIIGTVRTIVIRIAAIILVIDVFGKLQKPRRTCWRGAKSR